MRLINLTPHAIVLCGVTIPPSGTVARAASHEELVGEFEHPDSDDPESLTTSVPVLRQQFGVVTGIPDPSAGVGYIVSALAAQAVPERNDVFIPARPVRDGEGRIVACEALATLSRRAMRR